MHPIRKKRLIMVFIIVCGTAVATALALSALKQNINLYYTPSQVVAGLVPKQQIFRMGGIVEKGSVHHGKGLAVSFVLSDTAHSVKVVYKGILPDLFREGQGIITQGKLNRQNIFIAAQVLAKHGADYMPKPVADAIKAAKAKQQEVNNKKIKNTKDSL